jgi:HD-like signal output (HDOD) protein
VQRSAIGDARPETPGAARAVPGSKPESDRAFEFVQELVAALNSGKIELPSFPAVALRVCQVLNDENSSTDRIVRVLGSEPALAARLLRMANSVALNPLGQEVRDLKVAVLRAGLDVLRTAAITFALSQLSRAREYRGLESELEDFWHRSTLVAATCYATARSFPGFRPDEAMLAGLLHGVGRLYILCTARRHPVMNIYPDSSRQIADLWSAQVGKAMLASWGMPEILTAAVHAQETRDRDPGQPGDLTDVLIIGKILANRLERPEAALPDVRLVASLARLRLAPQDLDPILESSRREIDSLRAALGLWTD